MKDAVLALPFDQYQRYRLVADLLEELRGGGPPLRVLDVGGRTAVLRDFLEGARIEIVDLEPSDSAGLVLGDGAKLPFVDGAVDVVCAFDTLEHVPPALREAFVAECRRVARRWVVLAGPYESPRVARAEELLAEFLKDKLGVEHRYLAEHRRHGLPQRAAVEAQLSKAGGKVLALPHGNLERWLVLQCLSMYLDYDAALRGVAKDFQRWYNAELYASDHAGECYRHVVVAAFGDARLPSAEQLVGKLLAPPAAPAGALAPFTKLVPALIEFDAERDRWRAERKKFEEVVEQLRTDLEGHRKTTAELRTESGKLEKELLRVLAEHAAESAGLHAGLEALTRDLDGHRSALALADDELRQLRASSAHGATLAEELLALRASFEGRTNEHQRELDEWRALVADRERDLAGHRAALRNVEAELDGHRAALSNLQAELERARAHVGQLTVELGAERAVVADVRADLEGHKATLANVQSDLAGHQAALANVSRDLEGERAARLAAEQALARSDAELRRIVQVAGGLEQSLAKRELVYDELRRQLRSRWLNLVRVFRPMR